MTHWHHAHSVFLGVLLGLMLDHHVFLLSALILVLGITIGRAWGGLIGLARGASGLLRKLSEDRADRGR